MNVLRTINRVLSTNKSCFCTAAPQTAFKSAISTHNLYPNSNQKLTTPKKVGYLRLYFHFICTNDFFSLILMEKHFLDIFQLIS